MSLKRISLTGNLNSQPKVSGKKFSSNRVSLRRFPFPSVPAGPGAYIEDVFSTWVYRGNGSSVIVTNGIDFANNSGLVWIKSRSGSTGNRLTDTVRGATLSLASDSAAAQVTESTGLTTFSNNGFTIGSDTDYNTNATTYTSWTFRKQAKFFDVVTYTGNGVAGRNISHSLGSTPGFITVKKTSNTGDWPVYHRSRPAKYLYLNSTAAEGDDSSGVVWGNGTTAVAPTSTNFTVNALTAFPAADINKSGETYVAYLFAHNAGGFGPTGTDNGISCGGYTTTSGASQNIDLGFEPQWVLLTRSSGAGAVTGWFIFDNIRINGVGLYANSVDAESTVGGITFTSTGFTVSSFFNGGGTAGYEFIYIAVRRGPMKNPTVGTQVYNAILRTGDPNVYRTHGGLGFPLDTVFANPRNSSFYRPVVNTRLQGVSGPSTDGDGGSGTYGSISSMDGFTDSGDTTLNSQFITYVHHAFRRFPGFHDLVSYVGNGSNRTISHQLGVPPELIILYGGVNNYFPVYANNDNTDYLLLNSQAGSVDDNTFWNDTSPTSTVFSLGTSVDVNGSGRNFYAMLFATIPGISKVGSYTGTGTTLQIDCGFTTGARYVLIKRWDGTSDWNVWDSARGITSGNDPYVFYNRIGPNIGTSTAREVSNTDYINPHNPGFQINSTAPAAINANGGTYIFLAIA